MSIRYQPVKIYSELEQLIYKYESGFLPDSTILHADRVVWLIDHPTGSVFALNENNNLFVAPLVETEEFDKPEKRIYNDRSNGKRYTWLSDDFSPVSDTCEWIIKQRHKLIKMQLMYEGSLKASQKSDHDVNSEEELWNKWI